jgi:hypothetical protein
VACRAELNAHAAFLVADEHPSLPSRPSKGFFVWPTNGKSFIIYLDDEDNDSDGV